MILLALQVSANTEKQKESKSREILSSADGLEMACIVLMHLIHNIDLEETLISSYLPQDQKACWHTALLGEREICPARCQKCKNVIKKTQIPPPLLDPRSSQDTGWN